MNFEILLNSVLRLPMNKATKLLDNYRKNVGFRNFYEQQRVLDILTHKANAQRQIKEETFQETLMCLAFMAKDKSPWSKVAFENIKNYPMIIWIECIGIMDSQSVMSLLNNYHKELPSSLIETCIINLPEKMQLIAIDKYKSNLNPEDRMYFNFFYSVSEKARLKLRDYFPNQIGDDILLELQDLDENEVFEKLSSEHERLMKLSADDLIEFILLKSHKLDTLNRFLELFSDKVNECSIPKFELLFTRYKYLGNYRGSYFENANQQSELLNDSDLFKLFKS